MGLIDQIGQWFDRRLQLAAPIRAAAEHPVPRNTASWFYVFGSAALTLFLLQLVTGILLALIYVPSAGEAWNVLHVLNRDVSAGSRVSGPRSSISCSAVRSSPARRSRDSLRCTCSSFRAC